MKKILYLMAIMLPMILASCSEESKIKNEAISYIKENLPNPSSFKLKSIEIKEGEIPYYFDKEIQEKIIEYGYFKDKEIEGRLKREKRAYRVREPLESPVRYEDGYDENGKYFIRAVYLSDIKKDVILPLYSDYQKQDKEKYYMVFLEYSAENKNGGNKNEVSILFIDPKSKEVVLKEDVGDPLATIIFYGKTVCEGYTPEKNKEGKLITNDMSFLEQFVFDHIDE